MALIKSSREPRNRHPHRVPRIAGEGMGKSTAKRVRRDQVIEQRHMVYTPGPLGAKIDPQGHVDPEIIEKKQIAHLYNAPSEREDILK